MGISGTGGLDSKNAASLHQELKNASIVKKEELPEDVVRLNSRVVILDSKDRLFELALVLPDKAGIKKGFGIRPIGTAPIGFREGEKITWDVPAGRKTFTIMKVYNE